MQKFFEEIKRPQFPVGYKYKKLTVSSEPYYIYGRGTTNHRRQHVDCVCECSNVREFVQCSYIKNANIFGYCSHECPLYLEERPNAVPEENKLCKIGEIYNSLTITKEAFYHKLKGESRTRCVEVVCKCGKIKIYRESKVFNKSYKSCGCVWEYSGVESSYWKHIEKNYGISKEEYNSLLSSQNMRCAICGSEETNNIKTNKMYVDHCHETGKVRGLLCNGCNSGLGHFKDSINNLKLAIEYLS